MSVFLTNTSHGSISNFCKIFITTQPWLGFEPAIFWGPSTTRRDNCCLFLSYFASNVLPCLSTEWVKGFLSRCGEGHWVCGLCQLVAHMSDFNGQHMEVVSDEWDLSCDRCWVICCTDPRLTTEQFGGHLHSTGLTPTHTNTHPHEHKHTHADIRLQPWSPWLLVTINIFSIQRSIIFKMYILN